MKNPEEGQFTLSAFLRHLVLWCDLSACGTLQREAACELFAMLVNKYTDGVCYLVPFVTCLDSTCHSDVSDVLDQLLTTYYPSTLNDPGVPPEA